MTPATMKVPETISVEDAPAVLADTIPKIASLGRALHLEAMTMYKALRVLNLLPAPPVPAPVLDTNLLDGALSPKGEERTMAHVKLESGETPSEAIENVLQAAQAITDAAHAVEVSVIGSAPTSEPPAIESPDESANMAELARFEETRASSVLKGVPLALSAGDNLVVTQDDEGQQHFHVEKTPTMPTEAASYPETLVRTLTLLFANSFAKTAWRQGRGLLKPGVAGLKQYVESVYAAGSDKTKQWPTGFYRGPNKELEFYINHPTLRIYVGNLFASDPIRYMMVVIVRSKASMMQSIDELDSSEAYLVATTVRKVIDDLLRDALAAETDTSGSVP